MKTSLPTDEDVQERVLEIIASILGHPRQAVGPGSAPGVTPGWDSLAHMRIVLAVEDRFDIHISDQAVVQLLSAEAMVASVITQLAGLDQHEG
jgi:acyl carrier protein